MNAHEFRTRAAFDTALTVGQHVMIHWTNSSRWYDAAATITKVNGKSVLAAIEHPIYGDYGEGKRLLYPAGHVIKAPRLTDIKAWTVNNCVTPLDKPRLSIPAIARQIA
jgi:hypothetical protein